MLQEILEATYEKELTSFSFLLVNELCGWPYHSTSIVLFLSASHTNYHHFFIRSCSMLSAKDLDDFATSNHEMAERLVRVYYLNEHPH